MQYPELDELLTHLADIEQLDARQHQAFDAAVGTGVDDAVDPSVVASVWRGKLASLDIHDAVCKLPADDAAILINAVVIDAIVAWQQDYLHHAGL